jgi:hypothetical protein
MSRKSENYNGWTNHATWCVNLWLSNDESSYRHWQRATRGEKAIGGRKYQIVNRLAERLENELSEECKNSNGHGMWQEISADELSLVNWREIARDLLEE